MEGQGGLLDHVLQSLVALEVQHFLHRCVGAIGSEGVKDPDETMMKVRLFLFNLFGIGCCEI